MTHPTATVFALLQRRLLARRALLLEPFVRFALLALTAITMGFLFWQARLPIHGQIIARGSPAGAQLLAGVLAALALAAGATTAAQASRLARRPPGPPWLHLPIPAEVVGRHLLFEARLPAVIALPAALAVIAAGAGILPWVWLVLFAGAFLLAWLESTRLGAAFAWRLAAARSGTDVKHALFVRVLAGRAAASRKIRRAPAHWEHASPRAAIEAKDRALSGRHALLRSRLATAALFALLALLAWATPQPPLGQAAISFAAYLVAMGSLGLWSAALVGFDPPALWRPLPVTLREGWRARAGALALGAAALPVASAAFAAGLSGPARAGIALTWWPAGFVVAALALHHALTLYPDARTAQRVTTTWFSVALASSLMIPLLGWIVLIAGFVHATFRLARGRASDTR